MRARTRTQWLFHMRRPRRRERSENKNRRNTNNSDDITTKTHLGWSSDRWISLNDPCQCHHHFIIAWEDTSILRGREMRPYGSSSLRVADLTLTRDSRATRARTMSEHSVLNARENKFGINLRWNLARMEKKNQFSLQRHISRLMRNLLAEWIQSMEWCWARSSTMKGKCELDSGEIRKLLSFHLRDIRRSKHRNRHRHDDENVVWGWANIVFCLRWTLEKIYSPSTGIDTFLK